MIAIAKPSPRTKRPSGWQQGFLVMMSDIVRSAHIAFRNLDPEARQEAVQEVLVSAMLAYVRLFERQKVDVAYPSALARFAIAQYRVGRRVSTKLNCNDVLSPFARRKKNFRVETLTGGKGNYSSWRELLPENREAGPAETAAARIDISEWFESFSSLDREIAEALSMGYSTKEVAQEFQVSAPRISQKRREFLDSWQMFQGEDVGRSSQG
jgi:transposase-like protein